MDSGTRTVVKICVWIAILVVAAIIAAVVRNQKTSRLRKILSVLSQAVSTGRYSEALEVAREFLCITCAIKGIRKSPPLIMHGMQRNSKAMLQKTLAGQLQTTAHLQTIYSHSKPTQAQLIINEIDKAIAQQQSILNDDTIFSFVHGGPKKEIVESFNAAQVEKERLARSLPPLT